jgi:putative transposase
VCAQILRAAREQSFEITAYCYMPDHVHLLVSGVTDTSDCLRFVKAAKQYSGYYFQQAYEQRLWERYGFERAIRDDIERASVIGYIVSNPVQAGLVSDPRDYPYLGSQRYTVSELMEICEYR